MGMAERSDAIVIVVSEETGVISVAYDFSLERNLKPNDLRKFLQEHVLNVRLEDSEK